MFVAINKQNLKSNKKTLGKSEARMQFLPLVDAVSQGAGPIEITDYGKVVAVLIGKHDFDWLLAHTKDKPSPTRVLRGLGRLMCDLEDGSKEITESLQSSLKRTAKEL